MMDVNKKSVYETTVKEIGNEALDFSAIKMAILFGNEAPDALRSSCYIIDVKPVKSEITPGMVLVIDNNTYKITAVGNEVKRNLNNLGHIAISFTGKNQAELAGTLYVEDKDYPQIKVGSQIELQANV